VCIGEDSVARPRSYRNSPRVWAEISQATLKELQAHLQHLQVALELYDHEPDPTYHETACRHAVQAREILQRIAL